MSWRTAVRGRDDAARRDQHERERGYDDGYANRPARSSLAVYQLSWKRGREARERDGLHAGN